jgi:uncharacterized Ntn-hydrolase superfamily protein
MHTSNNVRKAARDIVIAFAHHIKGRIQSQDDDYVELRVDDDFDIYSDLFRSVAEKVLGINTGIVRIFPNSVVTETLDIVEEKVNNMGYQSLIENKFVAECVFEICLFILKKVKEDEFEDDLIEVN